MKKKKIIIILVLITVCSLSNARNWSALADAIRAKQRSLTGSECFYEEIDRYCNIRKHKNIVSHFKSVCKNNDTLYFIEYYNSKYIVDPENTEPRTIFWVKSENCRGALMYRSPSDMTSSWEFLYSFKHKMDLCNNWSRWKIESESLNAKLIHRRYLFFIRVVILPNDKYKVDAFYCKEF